MKDGKSFLHSHEKHLQRRKRLVRTHPIKRTPKVLLITKVNLPFDVDHVMMANHKVDLLRPENIQVAEQFVPWFRIRTSCHAVGRTMTLPKARVGVAMDFVGLYKRTWTTIFVYSSVTKSEQVKCQQASECNATKRFLKKGNLTDLESHKFRCYINIIIL